MRKTKNAFNNLPKPTQWNTKLEFEGAPLEALLSDLMFVQCYFPRHPSPFVVPCLPLIHPKACSVYATAQWQRKYGPEKGILVSGNYVIVKTPWIKLSNKQRLANSGSQHSQAENMGLAFCVLASIRSARCLCLGYQRRERSQLPSPNLAHTEWLILQVRGRDRFLPQSHGWESSGLTETADADVSWDTTFSKASGVKKTRF